MPLASMPSAPNAPSERAHLALRVGWRVTVALSVMVWAWTVWSHRRPRAEHPARPTAPPSWDTELARGGHPALSGDDAHRLAQEASRMQDA
jgi:hypothetical protein